MRMRTRTHARPHTPCISLTMPLSIHLTAQNLLDMSIYHSLLVSQSDGQWFICVGRHRTQSRPALLVPPPHRSNAWHLKWSLCSHTHTREHTHTPWTALHPGRGSGLPWIRLPSFLQTESYTRCVRGWNEGWSGGRSCHCRGRCWWRNYVGERWRRGEI